MEGSTALRGRWEVGGTVGASRLDGNEVRGEWEGGREDDDNDDDAMETRSDDGRWTGRVHH